MRTAVLTLEDGATFPGRVYGRPRSVAGEVVFNTGMVGYTEALTDPSYRGQIMVLTYPLVGNYGVPPAFESSRIQASALVVSEMAEEYSHAEAQKSLPQWLDEEGIPCIAGVDTRALTKRLRTRGCMLGKIVVGGEDIELSDPNKENLVAQVGNGTREVYPGKGKTVLLVDCGAKGSIIEELRSRGLRVIRVPWDHDFLAEDFDPDPRQRRAEDRRGGRVRLLRQPGHQGAARGGRRDDADQPEHRDDPDVARARRPRLSPARRPRVRRA